MRRRKKLDGDIDLGRIFVTLFAQRCFPHALVKVFALVLCICTSVFGRGKRNGHWPAKQGRLVAFLDKFVVAIAVSSSQMTLAASSPCGDAGFGQAGLRRTELTFPDNPNQKRPG